jgi:hypothetical protein
MRKGGAWFWIIVGAIALPLMIYAIHMAARMVAFGFDMPTAKSYPTLKQWTYREYLWAGLAGVCGALLVTTVIKLAQFDRQKSRRHSGFPLE